MIWNAVNRTPGMPAQVFSDETLYFFYEKTDSGYQELPSSATSMIMNQFVPVIHPEKDENGYTILTSATDPYKKYYADEDGLIWKKDADGNYVQVYPVSGTGYVKMKTTETDGPVYDWVISNQGLNLTLVGPGQQWFDYTFITSKKDSQGSSNDSTIGNTGMMSPGALQDVYSDYNYRNVFRFEDMDSTYGNMPAGEGDYEQFGARIFSFQDIWIFDGVITPYEKNVTINTSPYTTKESWDLAQAGRFWFYKPVPVDKTYDLSKNDWTLVNRPAGDLKITKRTSDGSGASETFTFTITLKGDGAENVTGTYGEVEFTGGMAVVELSAGESVIAKNLPAGLSYTVTETVPNYYVQASKSGDEGTIETGGTANAVFVNRKPVGSLTVEKRTEGGAPENDEFSFKVVLGDSTVNGTYGDMSFTGGTADLKLRSGQIAKASGLPAGISYKVTETVPAGYELKTQTEPEGTIPDGDTAKALFINVYSRSVTPVPPDEPDQEDVPDYPWGGETPTPTPAEPTPTPETSVTPTPSEDQPGGKWHWRPSGPKQQNPVPPEGKTPAVSPSTGDANQGGMWALLLLALASAGGTGVCIWIRKKRARA